MDAVVDRVILMWGKAIPGRLKLLKDYAAEPMQKCYAMAVLLFITDIGPTLRRCEHLFFEAAGIKSHVALIEMLDEPGFEDEVLSLIETQLPDHEWPPLERATGPKSCVQRAQLEPPAKCLGFKQLCDALETVPLIAAQA